MFVRSFCLLLLTMVSAAAQEANEAWVPATQQTCYDACRARKLWPVQVTVDPNPRRGFELYICAAEYNRETRVGLTGRYRQDCQLEQGTNRENADQFKC